MNVMNAELVRLDNLLEFFNEGGGVSLEDPSHFSILEFA